MRQNLSDNEYPERDLHKGVQFMLLNLVSFWFAEKRCKFVPRQKGSVENHE